MNGRTDSILRLLTPLLLGALIGVLAYIGTGFSARLDDIKASVSDRLERIETAVTAADMGGKAVQISQNKADVGSAIVRVGRLEIAVKLIDPKAQVGQ